jgi:hypothetical protein
VEPDPMFLMEAFVLNEVSPYMRPFKPAEEQTLPLSGVVAPDGRPISNEKLLVLGFYSSVSNLPKALESASKKRPEHVAEGIWGQWLENLAHGGALTGMVCCYPEAETKTLRVYRACTAFNASGGARDVWKVLSETLLSIARYHTLLTITLHKETGGDETEGMKKLRDAFGRARDPTAGEEEQLPKHPAPVWAAVDL